MEKPLAYLYLNSINPHKSIPAPRSFLLMICFLLKINCAVFAQSNGSVTYLYIVTPKHGFSSIEKKAVLLFEGQQASYTYNNPSTPTVKPRKDGVDSLGNSYTIAPHMISADPMDRIIYSHQQSGKFLVRDVIGSQFYIYQDTVPQISWKIGQEKRQVDTINCQKATGTFRGRTYEAWYAHSIPVSFGPWKLQGLPGLILEAHSQDGEVSFVFESLEIPSAKMFEIEPPSKGKTVSSFQEYVQLREEYAANERKKTEASFQELLKTLPLEQK